MQCRAWCPKAARRTFMSKASGLTRGDNGDGRVSEQISLRRQDIMQAADIRALMPGTALLLATGARPALITLRPWYSGPDATRIADATWQAEQAMRRGARRMAGLPADPGEGV